MFYVLISAFFIMVSAHEFKTCLTNPILTINEINLTPEPAVVGKDVTIVVSGSTSQTLTTMNAVVDVKAYGIHILSTTIDVCSQIKCPVSGSFEFTVIQNVPSSVPAGVSIDAHITLVQGVETVSCIDAEITFAKSLDKSALRLSSVDTVGTLYDLWLVQHGKNANDDELRNFRTNFGKIVAHNKNEKATFKMGFNKFSHLSSEQFREYMGLNKNVKINNNSVQRTERLLSSVPTSVDWSSHVISKNQQQCGSCFSFSCLGSIEGLYNIKYNKVLSLSEQEIVDCDTSAQGFSSQGCSGGLMSDCMSYVEKNGISSDAVYKYTATDGKCRSSKYPRVLKISSHTDINSGDETSTKNALIHQPIAIAINAADSLQSYTSGYLTESDCSSNQSDLNHGVLLTGFMEYMDGQKVYKILNSWGDWGENGFFYLTRNDATSDNNAGTCGMFLMASYPNDVTESM